MATPKKRRQYGSGSVYQRADGSWVGSISGVGLTRTGARRRIQVVRKTEASAKAALREKQALIAAEGLPSAGLGHATVKAWADVWLPLHQKEVRPRPFVNDRGNVNRWIIPTIGHRRLDQLTPADVRAVRSAITKAGRSTTTARNVHWTLMGMLKAARLEGHQVPARVTQVKAPGEADNDRDAVPLEDAVKLIRIAMGQSNYARWVASFLQGMRQGEVLGLTWDCIDFDRAVIDVSWQLQTLPYADPKNRAAGFIVPDGYKHRHLTAAWHLTAPKTAKGQRIIPLVPWMTAALREWRDVAPVNPWGLVWSDLDKNGNPIPVKVKDDRAEWADLQDAAEVRHPAGRRYVIHEMRNATATLLYEEGVGEATIIALLGHADYLMSRRYRHQSEALARQAMEAVAARLGLEETPALGRGPAQGSGSLQPESHAR